MRGPTDEECEVIRAHARELRIELLTRADTVRPGEEAARFSVMMTMLNWMVVEVLGWLDANAEPQGENIAERRRRVEQAVDLLAQGTLLSILGEDGRDFIFEDRESLN